MLQDDNEKGSTAFTVLASVAALSLAAMFAQNLSVRNRQTISEQKLSAQSEAIRINDVSGLSMIRGILTPAKVNATLYEPAAYPTNYFADSWTMKKNELRPMETFQVQASRFLIESFKNASPKVEDAASYFGTTNLKSVAGDLKTLNQFSIVRLNYDPVHKYYVNAVDIEAKTALSSEGGKEFSTVGRIPLPPPEPGPARLEISPAGSSTWSSNFGSSTAPLPAKMYKLRLIANGVVLFGEISGMKGGTIRLGMDEQGITHKANNIHAKDQVLGETMDIQLGEEKVETKLETVDENSTELSAHTVHNANCSFSVSGVGSSTSSGTGKGNTSATTSISESTENTITVKIFRVDGEESKVGFEQKIYVQSKVTTVSQIVSNGTDAATGAGGDRCRNRCPINRDSIFGHYMEFLTTSYVGGADKTKLDVIRLAESNGLPGKGGAICGNFELVAQDLVNAMGGVLPTKINSSPGSTKNWAIVKSHVDTGGSSMKLERFFAYIAPACGRELVGFRTGCGCFAEDTRIRMADGSELFAADIRPGDIVFNPRTGLSQRVKRVVAGPEKPLLFEIKLGGKTVKVTEDHPFLTLSGLKPANKLTPDDTIVEAEGALRIEAIDREKRASGQGDPEVWNFELEGSDSDDEHYVLANGIMTGDLYLQMKLKQSQSPSLGRDDR